MSCRPPWARFYHGPRPSTHARGGPPGPPFLFARCTHLRHEQPVRHALLEVADHEQYSRREQCFTLAFSVLFVVTKRSDRSIPVIPPTNSAIDVDRDRSPRRPRRRMVRLAGARSTWCPERIPQDGAFARLARRARRNSSRADFCYLTRSPNNMPVRIVDHVLARSATWLARPDGFEPLTPDRSLVPPAYCRHRAEGKFN